MTTNPPTPQIAHLSQQRLELAARLLRHKSGGPAPTPSIPRLPRTSEPSTFPLSFTQQRLWILDQLDPGLAAYHIPVAVQFMGRLDLRVLTQCLNEIGRRHEVLRTTFGLEAERPVQVIHPASPQPLPLIDLTSLEKNTRESELAHLIQAELHSPFDLTQGPLWHLSLFRLGEAEHLLLLKIHHIVCDGWSLGVIIREITAVYAAYSVGRPAPLPELPIQYADYAAWQRAWFQGDVLETQLAYWKKHLAGAATVLDLPSDQPRPATQSFRGAGQMLVVPSGVTEALKALSQREGVTLFMTMLAAFQTLLHRYSGQGSIIVGTPIANRTRSETEGLIGYFANTLALRTDLSGDPSFLDLLQRVRETALGAYAHQDMPFEHLVEALELERDLSRNPLFQVLFGLHNAPIPQFELPGLTIRRPALALKAETSRFDLALDMWESADALVGALEYNTDLFEAATLTRMIGHFQMLLAGIVADPAHRLSQLPLLTDAERRQMLTEWNAPNHSPASERCLPELFEAWAARAPDGVAVVCGDNRLTYAELDRRANQLAQHLKKLGIGPETPVAVCLERSVEMIVSLLGILKAGGAYVSLDPAYPPERLAFMLADSEARVLLTQSWLLVRVGSCQPPANPNQPPAADRQQPVTLCLDTDWKMITRNQPPAASNQPPVPSSQSPTPDSLAYIIYTSGSTGRPKGVQVTHRSVVHLLETTRPGFQFGPADVWSVFHSYAFDFSVWEIWSPLTSGGRLVIVPVEVAQSPADFADLLSAEQVTVLNQTPSALRHLSYFWQAAGVIPADSGLRLIVCGGEAFPQELAAHLLKQAVPVWNFYGPTEATVWATTKHVQSAQSGSSISIGRPLPDVEVYVLDAYGQPVPVGVLGELHIGGAGLARGYLNRPELTAEKFIPNPFAGMQEQAQGIRPKAQGLESLPLEPYALRLYRTGDLARYLPNGDIEYLGRMDHQVKVRGYRIELGEIEAALKRHPAVREAVALVREAVPGDQRLVAYLVPQAGLVPLTTELRQSLKESLPEYMLPSAFIVLEQLPLTPNGKLDRKALIRSEVEGLLASARVAVAETYVAPRNATETTLAKIWAGLLGLERVGIHDNFFTLGGDSLLAVRVLAQAGPAGLRFSTKLFFQHQTIAELAQALEAAPEINAEQGPVVGPVPLTPILHWYLNLDLPNPHFNNTALLLETPPGLDPAPLPAAVQEVLLHHDALRSRFERGASGWQARIVTLDQATAAVVGIDLSAVPLADCSAAIEAAAAELQTSLNLSHGPLLRVAHFDLGPAQSGRLLIVCHHLVIEALSLQFILTDLMTAYEQISRGQAVRLPPKTTSLKYWAERLAEYARSEALQFELGYWLSQPWDQVVPLPVDIPAERENNLQGRIETTAVLLSDEETAAMVQQVRTADDLHVADFLLTALRYAFAPWTGDRPLLVDLVGHGREPLFDDVDLSRTAHWSITLVPVFLEAAADPLQALRATRDARRHLPQGGIGFGVLRYLGEGPGVEKLKALPGAEVQFSYLGQTRSEASGPVRLRPARESAGMTIDPRNKRPELFYCHSQIRQGQLSMRFAYGDNLYRRATVEKLASDFIEALRGLILAQRSR